MHAEHPHKLTPTGLSRAVQISVPYASLLIAGKKTATTPLAIRIFRATGVKLAPIAEATDDEIAVLERFQGPNSGGVAA